MNWDKRWNRNYCLSSAFPHSTTQSRLEDPSLEKWNEVYKRITALGNGSTNITLCHAPYLVWYIGILLGTLLKREKRAEADHIASSMALMMQQRPGFLSFFFFFLCFWTWSTGQPEGTERIRGRNATSTQTAQSQLFIPSLAIPPSL